MNSIQSRGIESPSARRSASSVMKKPVKPRVSPRRSSSGRKPPYRGRRAPAPTAPSSRASGARRRWRAGLVRLFVIPVGQRHRLPWPPMDRFTGIPVRDVMQKNIVTISASDRLSTVEDIMTLGRVRHMPVVHAGKLVGRGLGARPAAGLALEPLRPPLRRAPGLPARRRDRARDVDAAHRGDARTRRWARRRTSWPRRRSAACRSSKATSSSA